LNVTFAPSVKSTLHVKFADDASDTSLDSVSGFPFNVAVPLNVIGPTVECGGKSFDTVPAVAGKTSESEESGTPAGDQLLASDHEELTVPVHVRVTADAGIEKRQHTTATTADGIPRIWTVDRTLSRKSCECTGSPQSA
jgi:hypothetical protein